MEAGGSGRRDESSPGQGIRRSLGGNESEDNAGANEDESSEDCMAGAAAGGPAVASGCLVRGESEEWWTGSEDDGGESCDEDSDSAFCHSTDISKNATNNEEARQLDASAETNNDNDGGVNRVAPPLPHLSIVIPEETNQAHAMQLPQGDEHHAAPAGAHGDAPLPTQQQGLQQALIPVPILAPHHHLMHMPLPLPVPAQVAATIATTQAAGVQGDAPDDTAPLDGYRVKIWRDGSRYAGEWEQNKMSGYGEMRWADGRRYVGFWHENRCNGQGVLTYKDGRRYEGEYKDDKMDGRGLYYWAEGARYQGFYKEHKKHGRGVMTWKTGGRYDGEYVEDKMTGYGMMTWADGRRYEGQWYEGRCTGKGITTFKSGSRYVGSYVRDKMEGKGYYSFADGRRYEGEYLANQKHGWGVYMWADGIMFTGTWERGAPTSGTFLFPGGTCAPSIATQQELCPDVALQRLQDQAKAYMQRRARHGLWESQDSPSRGTMMSVGENDIMRGDSNAWVDRGRQSSYGSISAYSNAQDSTLQESEEHGGGQGEEGGQSCGSMHECRHDGGSVASGGGAYGMAARDVALLAREGMLFYLFVGDSSPCHNAPDKDTGLSPFVYACAEGLIDVVKWFLAANWASVHDQDDKDGATGMHVACHNGHLAIVQILAEAGASADTLNKAGATCVVAACQAGHAKVAAYVARMCGRDAVARSLDSIAHLMVTAQDDVLLAALAVVSVWGEGRGEDALLTLLAGVQGVLTRLVELAGGNADAQAMAAPVHQQAAAAEATAAATCNSAVGAAVRDLACMLVRKFGEINGETRLKIIENAVRTCHVLPACVDELVRTTVALELDGSDALINDDEQAHDNTYDDTPAQHDAATCSSHVILQQTCAAALHDEAQAQSLESNDMHAVTSSTVSPAHSQGARHRACHVSEVIGLCSNLTLLRISNTRISSLPRQLASCSALTYLALPSNKLASLPPAVLSLSALEILDVRNNALETLTEGISQLTALKVIDVTRNMITQMPSMRALCSLQTLIVNGNNLSVWPEGLSECSNLCVLEGNNNKGLHVPPFIENLTSLRRLCLSGNSLVQLFQDEDAQTCALYSPAHVHSISCRIENGIALDSAHTKRQEHTRMQDTQRGQEGDQASGRHDAEQQYCVHTSLPASLEALDLSYNALSHFPVCALLPCTSLTYLCLRTNRLTSVPVRLRELRALSVLDVRENDALHYLPSSLSGTALTRTRLVLWDCANGTDSDSSDKQRVCEEAEVDAVRGQSMNLSARKAADTMHGESSAGNVRSVDDTEGLIGESVQPCSATMQRALAEHASHEADYGAGVHVREAHVHVEKGRTVQQDEQHQKQDSTQTQQGSHNKVALSSEVYVRGVHTVSQPQALLSETAGRYASSHSAVCAQARRVQLLRACCSVMGRACISDKLRVLDVLLGEAKEGKGKEAMHAESAEERKHGNTSTHRGRTSVATIREETGNEHNCLEPAMVRHSQHALEHEDQEHSISFLCLSDHPHTSHIRNALAPRRTLPMMVWHASERPPALEAMARDIVFSAAGRGGWAESEGVVCVCAGVDVVDHALCCAQAKFVYECLERLGVRVVGSFAIELGKLGRVYKMSPAVKGKDKPSLGARVFGGRQSAKTKRDKWDMESVVREDVIACVVASVRRLLLTDGDGSVREGVCALLRELEQERAMHDTMRMSYAHLRTLTQRKCGLTSEGEIHDAVKVAEQLGVCAVELDDDGEVVADDHQLQGAAVWLHPVRLARAASCVLALKTVRSTVSRGFWAGVVDVVRHYVSGIDMSAAEGTLEAADPEGRAMKRGIMVQQAAELLFGVWGTSWSACARGLQWLGVVLPDKGCGHWLVPSMFENKAPSSLTCVEPLFPNITLACQATAVDTSVLVASLTFRVLASVMMATKRDRPSVVVWCTGGMLRVEGGTSLLLDADEERRRLMVRCWGDGSSNLVASASRAIERHFACVRLEHDIALGGSKTVAGDTAEGPGEYV